MVTEEVTSGPQTVGRRRCSTYSGTNGSPLGDSFKKFSTKSERRATRAGLRGALKWNVIRLENDLKTTALRPTHSMNALVP